MSSVVFVLVPEFHLLDLAGPAQVFGHVGAFGPAYRLTYVADQERVPSAQGVDLHAEVGWPTLTPDDLVLVPGWRSPRRSAEEPLGKEGLNWLRAHHDAGGTVASVCAGAFALAEAGLLNGRDCTTHHELQDELARRYPKAKVTRDVLYTVDGRVVTSAGIASGIDLALHLVATRHGAGTAARIARAMVVYARRNGEEQQQSAMLRHRAHLSDIVHHIQDTIDTRFTEPLPLSELARSAGVSERTVTRLFTEATGLTPLRYQQILRLERAEHLLGHGATMHTAARSVGFEDPRMLRRLRNRPIADNLISGK